MTIATLKSYSGSYPSEQYIPRDDPSAGNAVMNWRWCEIDDVLHASIDRTIKGEIANRLRGKADDVPEMVRFTRGGSEDPGGAIQLNVHAAFLVFCDQLAADSIIAIEEAMKTRAMPPSDEELDAGIPLPAGVIEGPLTRMYLLPNPLAMTNLEQ